MDFFGYKKNATSAQLQYQEQQHVPIKPIASAATATAAKTAAAAATTTTRIDWHFPWPSVCCCCTLANFSGPNSEDRKTWKLKIIKHTISLLIVLTLLTSGRSPGRTPPGWSGNGGRNGCRNGPGRWGAPCKTDTTNYCLDTPKYTHACFRLIVRLSFPHTCMVSRSQTEPRPWLHAAEGTCKKHK